MFNKLNEIRKNGNEEGFTLVEIMIVVVIIGILAAIAIPIFAAQQKAAVSATVKSDVKNTNAVIISHLSEDPTSRFVGGHGAVRVTQATPYFYVGTPADDSFPTTVGLANKAPNANVKAVITDSETVIEIYGYWNNYVIDGHNTKLTASPSGNYFSYRSNTGKVTGSGDMG